MLLSSRGLQRGIERPKSGERERHIGEGRSIDIVVLEKRVDQEPTSTLPLKDLQALGPWVDLPKEIYLICGIDGSLGTLVVTFGPLGQNLANPVGRNLVPDLIGRLCHALLSPTGDIGHQNVLTEVKLRFWNENPAAWSSITELVRPSDRYVQGSGRGSMATGRTGMRHEVAEQDLADHIRRQSLDVGVGC
jgi:hypothetical protein